VEGLGAEYRGDSGSERSSHSFFFAKTTPMNDSRSTNITNLSISNLVNSHFLDERWFDFHFLDNDFHFLNNRYGRARLRMHFLDNAFCALMNTRPKLSSDLTMRGAELVDVGVKDAMLKLIRCRNSERAAAFVGVPAQHTNRANRHQCGPSVHRYRGGQQVRQSSLHALEHAKRQLHRAV